jgi:hypothetical protein
LGLNQNQSIFLFFDSIPLIPFIPDMADSCQETKCSKPNWFSAVLFSE